jgi:hypothetical protein
LFRGVFPRAQLFCDVLEPSPINADKKLISSLEDLSFVIPSFFLSLDLMRWYAAMSACGSVIMLMIFQYFSSALGFSSRIRLAAAPTRAGEAGLS